MTLADRITCHAGQLVVLLLLVEPGRRYYLPTFDALIRAYYRTGRA